MPPTAPDTQRPPLPRSLLAVPNVSEGRDRATIDAVAAAFCAAGVRLLDRHSDPDHDRSVYTLAGAPGSLSDALLAGAREVLARVDIPSSRISRSTSRTSPSGASPSHGSPPTSRLSPPTSPLSTSTSRLSSSRSSSSTSRVSSSGSRGVHPHVGALDVLPVVHLTAADRGAACAEALVAAELIGSELGIPVFLYGVLADGRTRAQLRRGGPAGLGRRLAAGDLRPDFGPPRMHPSAGAVLVAARPPLVAFNLELAAPADLQTARRIAAAIREHGSEGLTGVRAIGLELARRGGTAQVSMNIEDPATVSLAAVIEAVGHHAEIGAGELVGLCPRVALEGLPAGLPLRGFDPARHVLENALGL